MRFEFSCYGHENILALHRNTIEFTKDKMLTRNGDCIVGVRADFDSLKLKEFVDKSEGRRITAEMAVDGIKEGFSFFINPDFSDEEEIVIRKTDFRSGRTLGVRADKAACNIKREFVNRLKDKNARMMVIFTA